MWTAVLDAEACRGKLRSEVLRFLRYTQKSKHLHSSGIGSFSIFASGSAKIENWD
jgi:hypothetical protein